MGSSTLLGDSTLTPIRGQIVKLDAPWMKHFILNDSASVHLFPGSRYARLGSVFQVGNYSESVNDEDTQEILKRGRKLIPSLKSAKVLSVVSALRPSRPKVRLQQEFIPRRNGTRLPVVHNYGHGGSGICLSWGCAQDTVKLVREYLPASKL